MLIERLSDTLILYYKYNIILRLKSTKLNQKHEEITLGASEAENNREKMNRLDIKTKSIKTYACNGANMGLWWRREDCNAWTSC